MFLMSLYWCLHIWGCSHLFLGKHSGIVSVQLNQLRSVSAQTVAVLCGQECAGPMMADFTTFTTLISESRCNGVIPGSSISWNQLWRRLWENSVAKVANGHNGESCWGPPVLLFSYEVKFRWRYLSWSQALWIVGWDNSG